VRGIASPESSGPPFLLARFRGHLMGERDAKVLDYGCGGPAEV